MADVQESIDIDAPPEHVFDLFRDPDTFVEIISHLRDAERHGDTVEWEAAGPLGISLTGQAEIVEEDRPSRVSWRSTTGDLEVRGTAEFEPRGDGTTLHYTLSFEMPGGPAAKALASALSDADARVRGTLRRLKALAEF